MTKSDSSRRSHPQILEDDDETKNALAALEKENKGLKDLVVRLTQTIVRKTIDKK